MPKKDLRQMKAKKAGMSKEELKKAAEKANLDIEGVKDENLQGYEETIEKYSQKSEEELMNDLEHMIGEGRRDGTFSDDMLESFVKNVAPMMDENQRKKLENLTRMIKMNKI